MLNVVKVLKITPTLVQMHNRKNTKFREFQIMNYCKVNSRWTMSPGDATWIPKFSFSTLVRWIDFKNFLPVASTYPVLAQVCKQVSTDYVVTAEENALAAVSFGYLALDKESSINTLRISITQKVLFNCYRPEIQVTNESPEYRYAYHCLQVFRGNQSWKKV